MACRGHFYFDRNGKAVSGAGVNFDITDYKQAEDNRIRFIQEQAAREEERQRVESLAEIDRAKTEFFTNISHEFRTPLTLLLAPLQDALSDCDNPLSSPQRQRLQLAYGNSQRLLKLVNTLLDFSRIQANRMQAVYEPTDLAMFTTELASVFRSAIERAGLRLIVDCPPLLEPVYVDRQMWEKVVLNLLSNAFKFTLEGEITVSLRSADNHHVTLQVQDTGTGIPSEELPHLFERFYRIQNRQARTHEGSGIGLALVQELIKMHSGTVDVSSLVGEGTCFTVTIPKGTTHLPSKHIRATGSLTSNALGASPYVREAERWVDGVEGVEGVEETRGQEDREQDAPTTNYQSPIPNPQSPIPHILLVDDNADMRDYLKRILSEYVEVEAVADGAAALFAVQQRVPDLVLTDVMMPQLDGLELLKALRTDTRTREVPIILLTARAGEEFLVEGLESGTDDYLIKPFSAQELVTRVLAHLRLAQLRGEALRQEKTANRMKDRLLAEISHELNAPLVAILGWTRLLRSSPPNQAMLTKSLETIEHNATLQAKLIQDLVDMSRISTGKISLNCQQVELQAAIQIAIAAVQHSLEAKDIRLECMLASLPITVHGDPDRLQQIFLNIISNAIKFTPNGGRIEVRLDASKTQAEISVRDTGIGITAEFLPHVFEIFRQAESSRGLGIGLAIARHLVELHNGTINAQSRGIGQGATFNFTLPLIDLRKI
ncbi:MAG: response regulator [Rivularia sp. (in: Bacteria)]|nr:response regulator [Rivularia sp. MS3]